MVIITLLHTIIEKAGAVALLMSEEVSVDTKMLGMAAKATLATMLLVLWQGASGISRFGYTFGDMDLSSSHGHSGELAFVVAIVIAVLVVKSKTDSSQLKGMAFGLAGMLFFQIGFGYMTPSMPWMGMFHVMMALGIMSHATILWYHLSKTSSQ